MKRIMVLVLEVLAILAFTGSTLGDDAGESLHCPVTLDEGERMNRKLFDLGRYCLDTSGTDGERIFELKTLEEHKDFFMSYCERQPQIRECLADVARKSQACQNETRHQSFQVFQELLETTLDSGCVQNGEVLATMTMIFTHKIPFLSKNNSFYDCLSLHIDKVLHSLRLDISDDSINYIFYRDIKLAKECFNGNPKGEPQLQESIASLLSVIVEKYKCFDPQDCSVVLCKNLDPIQDGLSGLCPFKTVDERTKPLYGVFLERLPVFLERIDLDAYQRVNILASRELTGRFFKLICEKENIVKSWLTDAAYLSSFCLDNAHNLMFQTLVSFLENIIDQLCKADGRYFADVMFKVVNDVANTTQQNALEECASAAHPPNKGIDFNFTSAKTLEYYQEIKVIKGCLLNKLKDDDVVFASAGLIFNGIINNMKCLNPEQTTLVFCEIIANTV